MLIVRVLLPDVFILFGWFFCYFVWFSLFYIIVAGLLLLLVIGQFLNLFVSLLLVLFSNLVSWLVRSFSFVLALFSSLFH